MHRFLALLLLGMPVLAGATGIRMTPEQSARLGIITTTLGEMQARGGIRLPAQVVVPPAQIEVIAAPLPAMVATVRVAHGETVKKGQVLVRLQGASLIELQREFATVRAQAELAGESLRRDESLYADGIISGARLSASRAAERQATLLVAEKRLTLRLAGLPEPNAGGALAAAAEIRAPFDGVVLDAPAQPGQRVDAMTPLFKLGRIVPLWLEIQATPAHAAGIAPGATVSVPGCPPGGRITVVAPHVDAHDQSLRLRAELPFRVPCVRPYQFVQVDVKPVESVTSYAWWVPAGAVTRHLSRTWIFVAAPEGFQPVAVQVLEETAQSVRIAVPVEPTVKIAVKGISAIKGAWLGLGAGEQ